VNGTNTTELILSDSILDNPDLGFYQAVYGGVLIFVVVFAFANASSFMMVSHSPLQHIQNIPRF